MKKLVLLFMVVVGLCSHSVIAQTADEEEKFDNTIEQFGYVSGKAFQCADPKQAPSIEKDTIRAFNGIARLFGTERAFFYAAAYGSGAKDNIDRSECSQYLRQFQQALEKSPLKRGE
jgi:hypothetical protein